MSAPRSESILVVEDDEGVALLERRALERRGFAVTSAVSLDEALAAVRHKPIDLIVTDYRLEASTGLELFERVASLGFDIPVILVTGHSDEATVLEALRCGVRDFVPKTAEYLQYLPDAVERVLKAVKTERDLGRSEARFHLFMDNSPAAAFIKDGEGRLLYANRATQQIIGGDDWLGKTDAELWPPATAEQLRQNDLSVLRGESVSELREAVTLPNGAVRHFSAYKFPMQDASGERWLGGMAIDISQQLAAEDALRERNEQLRQSQKMEAVGTLAGGVAHEFNNLLQAVLGYTRFAMSSIGEDHAAQADLKIVVSAADRAALLTQQLLSFSRRETGQPVPVDLNMAIHEIVAMLRPLLGEHIKIALSLTKNLDPLLGDPTQIQQMLMNLCINARDAMPEGGTITITTGEATKDAVAAGLAAPGIGRFAALSVSDTGCGMSAEVKQKIFEPFFTTKAVGCGTGLGLAMVYGTVQHHSGQIQVESQPGVGTRFSIYLPFMDAASWPERLVEAVGDCRGSERILIAEDEPLVLALSKRLLQDAGYQVLAARDGREAVNLFTKHRHEIDLLILDAVMPELGGWEAIREIREVTPSLPAIILSGYDPKHGETLALDGPPPRVIQKPVESSQLLLTVRAALQEVCVCL
jgi:PAS domain S-box-containing protein